MINLKLLNNITQFNNTVKKLFFPWHIMHFETTINITIYKLYLVFMAFHEFNSIWKNSISMSCQIQSNTSFINNFLPIPIKQRTVSKWHKTSYYALYLLSGITIFILFSYEVGSIKSDVWNFNICFLRTTFNKVQYITRRLIFFDRNSFKSDTLMSSILFNFIVI